MVYKIQKQGEKKVKKVSYSMFYLTLTQEQGERKPMEDRPGFEETLSKGIELGINGTIFIIEK